MPEIIGENEITISTTTTNQLKETKMTNSTAKQAHLDFDEALNSLCLEQDKFQEHLKAHAGLNQNDAVFEDFAKLGNKIADVKKASEKLQSYTYSTEDSNAAQADKVRAAQNEKPANSKANADSGK